MQHPVPKAEAAATATLPGAGGPTLLSLLGEMDAIHRQVQTTGNSVVASSSHTMVKKLLSFASSLEASKSVTKGTEPRANVETKHNRKAVCTSHRLRADGGAARRWLAHHQSVGSPSPFRSNTRQGHPLSGGHAAAGGESTGPTLCSADSRPTRDARARGTGHLGREARPCRMHLPSTSLSGASQEQSSSQGVFKSNPHVKMEASGPVNVTGIFFTNHHPFPRALCPWTSLIGLGLGPNFLFNSHFCLKFPTSSLELQT